MISLELISNRVGDLLKENNELKVIIHADETTPYNLVVRVLDKIRLGGCFNIALQTKKTRA